MRSVAIGQAEEDVLAKRGPELVDPRLAKALEHPIRTEILVILRHGPSSPARIQRQLENVSLNLVSHHMKVLKKLGCIELAETVNKRGATEHVYRAVRSFIVSDEEWRKLTPKMRLPLTATVLRLLSNDLAQAIGAGRLDEIPDTHLSRTPLKLDREGWSEAVDILARTLDEILEVGGRSVKRMEAGGEPPLRVTVAIMQFLTGDVPTVDDEAKTADD